MLFARLYHWLRKAPWRDQRHLITITWMLVGLIHHSDQGVQYACTAYTEVLKAAGIVSSMSRTGNPYDNARMESFFKTLKAEEVNLQEYTDLDEAREGIGTFITLYNERRLHSSLGYVPPAEFAAQYHQAQI